MTIQDFLAVDSLTLARLTDAQLREIATGGRKIANQRISRLKAAEMTNSPAFQALPAKVKSAGFKTAGLNRNALLNQIQQQQQFVRGRTSTVVGWKKEQVKAATKAAQVTKGLKSRYGYDEAGQFVVLKPGEKSALTQKQVGKYWELFHKMQQDPKRGGSVGSPVLQKTVYDVIKENPRNGVKSLEKILAERLDEEYEEMQEERASTAEDIRRGGGRRLS